MALVQETHTQSSSAEEARLVAEEFILDHMGDQITAGPPWLVHSFLGAAWVAPLILTSSSCGIVGTVGALVVDSNTRHVVAYTPTKIVQANAQQLFERQQSDIQVAFKAAIGSLS